MRSTNKRYSTITALLIFLCILAVNTTYCQIDYLQRTWTSKDGLHDSNSFSIAQTKKGEITVINDTPTTMHFIDGYKVAALPTPSNTSNIVIDQQDDIWASITTNERKRIIGFQRLDRESKTWVPYSFDHFYIDIDIHVTEWQYHVISSNAILFSNSSSLYQFSLDDLSVQEIHRVDENNPYLHSSNSNGHGQVLFPHQIGITQLNGSNTNQSTSFTINEIPYINTLDNLVLTNINPFGAHEWFGTASVSNDQSGIVQIINNTLTYTPTDRSPLQWGWKINDDTVAKIDNDNDLTICNLHDVTAARTYSLKTKVKDIVLSKESPSFFIATQNGIKHYLPFLFQTVPSLKNSTPNVHSFLEDSKKRIWMAAVDHLILLENGEITTINFPNGANTTEVYTNALIEMPDGRILINISFQSYDFPDYLYFYNPGTKEFESVHHPKNRFIYSVIPCKTGGLWLKTKYIDTEKYVLEKYHNGSFQEITNQDQLPDLYYMRSLAESDTGDLWISHVDSHGPGVFRNGVYTPYHQEDGYAGSGAYSLMIDRDDNVWSGSRDGIFLWKDDKWTLMNSGLDAVRSIIQSRDGSIWVASGNGLHHYKNGAWISYTEQDNLPSSHVFEVMEDSKGRIWVGTTEGVRLYHPEYDINPPLTLIQNEVNSTEFSYNSLVQFTLSGIDKWKQTIQEDLLFSYHVNDDVWSEFEVKPNIQINGLQAGNHTLHVRSMDRNFNIDSSPATFEFYIHSIPLQNQPYFLPAITTIILVLAMLTFLLFQSRNQLSFYTKHLESIVSNRTKQLKQSQTQFVNAIENEQERIGNELHDGVVQDLAAIAMTGSFIAKELQQSNNNFANEVENVVDMIDRSSKQIRKIAKGLSPIQLDSTGLISTIEKLASQISATTTMQCTFRYDESIPDIPPEKLLHLYRFVQEAVSNAVKHSQATAINISVTQENQHFQVLIRDNGTGFDVETQRNKGLGIHTLQYRAEELGGTLSIKSVLQQGSEICCAITKEPNQ